MEHRFHNHSLRKNSLIEEELRAALIKIEKQKHEKLDEISSKRNEFRKLHSRQCIKRSLELEADVHPPQFTTVKTLQLIRDSKRFSSEPDLFAKRTAPVERKQTFTFHDTGKCLSYRKLKCYGKTTMNNSLDSCSLDSGMEHAGRGSAGSSISDSADDLSHSSSHSTPVLHFPMIGHSDLKHNSQRTKLGFSKAMADRISTKDGWKYLMTNVFKRLNEGTYKTGKVENKNPHNVSMDEVALCRYLRIPMKNHHSDEHLRSKVSEETES